MKSILVLFVMFIPFLNLYADTSDLESGQKYLVFLKNGDKFEAVYFGENKGYYVFKIADSSVKIKKSNVDKTVNITDDADSEFYFRFKHGQRYTIELMNNKIIKGAYEGQTDSTVIIRSGQINFNVRKSDILSIDLQKLAGKKRPQKFKNATGDAYNGYFLLQSNIPVGENHIDFNLNFTDAGMNYTPIKDLFLRANIDLFSALYFLNSIYGVSVAYNVISHDNLFVSLELKHSGYFEVDNYRIEIIRLYDLVDGFNPEIFNYNSFGTRISYADKNLNFTTGLNYLFGTEEIESGALVNFGARFKLSNIAGVLFELQDFIVDGENFLLLMGGGYVSIFDFRLKFGLARYNTMEQYINYNTNEIRWKVKGYELFPVFGVDIYLDNLFNH